MRDSTFITEGGRKLINVGGSLLMFHIKFSAQREENITCAFFFFQTNFLLLPNCRVEVGISWSEREGRAPAAQAQQHAEIYTSTQAPPTRACSACGALSHLFVGSSSRNEPELSLCLPGQRAAYLDVFRQRHKSDTLQGLFFQSVCIYGGAKSHPEAFQSSVLSQKGNRWIPAEHIPTLVGTRQTETRSRDSQSSQTASLFDGISFKSHILK